MKTIWTALLSGSLLVWTNAHAGSATWTNPGHWGEAQYTRAGDFNGDGRTDVVSPVSFVNWGVYLSNGFNAFTGSWQLSCLFYGEYGNWDYIQTGDVDGDGRDEYLSPNGGYVNIYHFSGSSPVCPGWVKVPANGSYGSGAYTWVGDFNGDGYDDIASASGSNVYLKFGNANVKSNVVGFASSATWTVDATWGQGAYTKVGDFNGDLKTDIASLSGANAYMKLSTGSGFVSTTWSISNLWGEGQYTFAGDFNGDGLDDIASCAGGTCYMKQSTGAGFTNPGNQTVDSTWGNPWHTYVGDFQADGNDDIASMYGSSALMKLIAP